MPEYNRLVMTPGRYKARFKAAQFLDYPPIPGKPITSYMCLHYEVYGMYDTTGNLRMGKEPVAKQVHINLGDKCWVYAEKKLQYLGFTGDWETPAFNMTLIGDCDLLLTNDRRRDGSIRETWTFPEFETMFKKTPTPVSALRRVKFAAKWSAGQGQVLGSTRQTTQEMARRAAAAAPEIPGDKTQAEPNTIPDDGLPF